MGTPEKMRRQEELWVAASQWPVSAACIFYRRFNQLPDENRVDRFADQQCSGFYAKRMGRPSSAPSIYFRLLLAGYFDGIDSEMGIAWRAADSLAIRRFVGEAGPQAGGSPGSLDRDLHWLFLRRMPPPGQCAEYGVEY